MKRSNGISSLGSVLSGGGTAPEHSSIAESVRADPSKLAAGAHSTNAPFGRGAAAAVLGTEVTNTEPAKGGRNEA
jgi:hypothetical protein